VCVGESVCERESECVRERVCVRESVCAGESEIERESVCVCERERVCVCERERYREGRHAVADGEGSAAERGLFDRRPRERESVGEVSRGRLPLDFPRLLPQRESSLLITYWSESTQSSR